MSQLLGYPTVREALLYSRLRGGRVRCGLCERRCLLGEGQRGFCKTRVNASGRLCTLVYGDISSLSANPIEKKPFFHFHPGSLALTAGGWSCNYTCPWCQNWGISKTPPDPSKASYLSPERFVALALQEGCQGTSISFNEPTLLFEYSFDAFPLARRRGLYNNYVSNGYMTLEALRMLREAGMDAIKFDLKGDDGVYRRRCGGVDVGIVWRNAREARGMGLHVEVVSLLIPGVNDDEECIRWVVEQHLKNLGPETPLHFTRFCPAYKFAAAPTPVKSLEEAREVARKSGVLYPYIGNVPGHRFENTWCPGCGALLIERYGFSVTRFLLTRGWNCPGCGNAIPIVGLPA